MDLEGYSNIERLSNIAKANGIVVPRLRGLRLMSEEKQCLIEDVINDNLDRFFYQDFVSSYPAFSINPRYYEISKRTKRLRKKYLTKNETDLRWDKIHGKKRKNAKYIIKITKRKIEKQYKLFNKFAGQKNVLYIHARIGGRNWNTYGGPEIEKKEWFLGKADDYFDSTYCDIYAKIDTIE